MLVHSSRTGSGNRRRGWLQGLSAAVSLCLVFTQTVAALHFALVPHRFCLEHGLEEVHAGARARLDAPSARYGGAGIDRVSVVDDAHDACLLASLHEPRATILPASAGRIPPPPATRGPCAVRAGPAHAHQALLLVAPKQGPPV